MERVYGAPRQPQKVSRDPVGSSSDTEHKLELSELHKMYLERENNALKSEVVRLEKIIDGQRDMLAVWHRRLMPPKRK